MRRLIRLIKFLLIIVLIFTILAVLPFARKYNKKNEWRNHDQVLIIPHGGAKELYPENTIYAFEETAKYDVFEVDLTLTKDDILITHHDLDLRMHLGDDYKSTLVREKTYDEILNLFKQEDYPFARNFTKPDGSEPYLNLDNDDEKLKKMVPATLEHMFKTYNNKRFILELKDTEVKEDFVKAVEVLIDLVDKYEMDDKIIVSSFSDDVIKEFKANSSIHTSTATKATFKFVLLSAFNLDFFHKPKDAALIIPIHQKVSKSQANIIKFLPVKNKFMKNKDTTNLAQKGIIRNAKRHNMAVIYWTINDEDEMRLLIELGVDGIVTDRPDLLEQILKEYK